MTNGPAIIYFVHNTSDGRMANNYLDPESLGSPNTCELARGKKIRYATPEDSVGDYKCEKAFEAESCGLFSR